jgi:hypothetical protein
VLTVCNAEALKLAIHIYISMHMNSGRLAGVLQGRRVSVFVSPPPLLLADGCCFDR